MKPEGLYPHLQGPTTCPYSEPDGTSPCSYILLPGGKVAGVIWSEVKERVQLYLNTPPVSL